MNMFSFCSFYKMQARQPVDKRFPHDGVSHKSKRSIPTAKDTVQHER